MLIIDVPFHVVLPQSGSRAGHNKGCVGSELSLSDLRTSDGRDPWVNSIFLSASSYALHLISMLLDTSSHLSSNVDGSKFQDQLSSEKSKEEVSL